MNVIPMPVRAESGREMIAAEVRAELARQGLTSNSLPQRVGRSQRYWYERLNARLAFSTDDLAVLSYLLRVPMSHFIPSVIAPFDPETQKGPAGGAAGPSLPELDSNQQPAG